MWGSNTYGQGVTGLTLTDTPAVQFLAGSTVVKQWP